MYRGYIKLILGGFSMKLDNLIFRYENYKGINDLIVVQNGYFGEIATSTVSKDQAIKNLKAKIKRRQNKK